MRGLLRELIRPKQWRSHTRYKPEYQHHSMQGNNLHESLQTKFLLAPTPTHSTLESVYQQQLVCQNGFACQPQFSIRFDLLACRSF